MNYFNSTIERRTGKCVDCLPDEPDKFLTAKRCDLHYKIYRTKKMVETQKVKNKFRSLKNTPENKEMAVKAGKETDTDLNLWFSMQMQANEKTCSNCLKSLNHYSSWAWKSSQHHILEKSIFPSVATNPLNHLVLCVYSCHSQWHSSMLNASKMPVFEKAKEKVIMLYPLLTDQEKGRISEYYNITTIEAHD